MIGYGIFLLVLVVIYVRSELLQVNPVVYLLLHRIVKVTATSGEDVYVIVRERPRVGQVLSVRSFAGIRVEAQTSGSC
jgi:fructose-1,6-bisphosphatase/sedoheptulose 1,7-bisphosphatase-like protein